MEASAWAQQDRWPSEPLRPGYSSNHAVLKDLNTKIEAAKDSRNTDAEARLIISRIVSHKHERGSLKQFNQDLASRYGIKNTIVRGASKSEVLNALEQGAPIIADAEGGWHWIMVRRSPRGKLWANDPLPYCGTRMIPSRDTTGVCASELGSRFELIVDAKTGAPILPNKAEAYKN